jgi:hypothetical protein
MRKSQPRKCSGGHNLSRSDLNRPVLVLLLLLLASAFPMSVARAATPSASGLVGGGFVNVVTANGTGDLAVGADVAGVLLSEDGSGGDLWATRNAGVTLPERMSIASLTYNGNTLYAAYGVGSKDIGGVAKSADGGLTWTVLNSSLVFSGQGENDPPADGTIVRPTGNLFAFDGLRVYVGTYNDGVWRYNGSIWEPIALDGDAECGGGKCAIRTLVQQPDDPTTLYVGTYGSGAYRITDADGAGIAASITSPANVEELVFDTSQSPAILYCACGGSGVFRAPKGAAPPYYNNWTAYNLNGSIETGGPQWVAIAAGGSPTSFVYVGAHDPAVDTGRYKSVKRVSSAGGTQWLDLTTDDNEISEDVCGATDDWWITPTSNTPWFLGRGNHDVAMLETVGNKLYVAGRSGVWRFDPTEDKWWCPAVNGMGLTAPKDLGIATASGNAGRVYVAATDWQFFHSTDWFDSVTRTQVVGQDPATYGFSVAVDPVAPPSEDGVADVYLGIGAGRADEAGGAGEVYMSADPSAGVWTSLDLRSATTETTCESDFFDGRPLGLAVGRQDDEPVVVAAVEGCGIWRWTSASGWQRKKGPAYVLGSQDGLEKAPVSWPTGSSLVYVLDPAQKNLWISEDHGQTWAPLWPNMPGPGLGAGAGYVAGDSTDPDRVWVTTAEESGTWLIDCADDTPNGTQFSGAGTPSDPGPVALRPSTNNVFIATRQDAGSSPKLWKDTGVISSCSSATVTWETVVDNDNLYKGTAVFPRNILVTNDATPKAYVGTAGQGAVKVEGPL